MPNQKILRKIIYLYIKYSYDEKLFANSKKKTFKKTLFNLKLLLIQQ